MNVEAILADAAKWAVLISVVASIINAFTKHYSAHKSVVKGLLGIAEHLSFLTSADTRQAGSKVKLPLQSVKPPRQEPPSAAQREQAPIKATKGSTNVP